MRCSVRSQSWDRSTIFFFTLLVCLLFYKIFQKVVNRFQCNLGMVFLKPREKLLNSEADARIFNFQSFHRILQKRITCFNVILGKMHLSVKKIKQNKNWLDFEVTGLIYELGELFVCLSVCLSLIYLEKLLKYFSIIFE